MIASLILSDFICFDFWLLIIEKKRFGTSGLRKEFFHIFT